VPNYRFTTQPLFYGSDEAALAAMPKNFYAEMERLPDPPIVKKFEVEITFPATNPPVPFMDYGLAIERSMTLDHAGPVFNRQDRTVKVREV
jgi:hypothetical protein